MGKSYPWIMDAAPPCLSGSGDSRQLSTLFIDEVQGLTLTGSEELASQDHTHAVFSSL